jgi:glutamate/tyrosine decarboxylase-like PLP-dependent enzyme
VETLVDRCCARARRFAEQLGRVPGVHVLNEVVLNQVLVRFDPPGGGDTRRVHPRGHHPCPGRRDLLAGWEHLEGQGRHADQRFGVEHHEEDVDRSVFAILRCAGRA